MALTARWSAELTDLKIDSALRGCPSEELLAIMARLARLGPSCALPSKERRTTVDGQLRAWHAGGGGHSLLSGVPCDLVALFGRSHEVARAIAALPSFGRVPARSALSKDDVWSGGCRGRLRPRGAHSSGNNEKRHTGCSFGQIHARQVIRRTSRPIPANRPVRPRAVLESVLVVAGSQHQRPRIDTAPCRTSGASSCPRHRRPLDIRQ